MAVTAGLYANHLHLASDLQFSGKWSINVKFWSFDSKRHILVQKHVVWYILHRIGVGVLPVEMSIKIPEKWPGHLLVCVETKPLKSDLYEILLDDIPHWWLV